MQNEVYNASNQGYDAGDVYVGNSIFYVVGSICKNNYLTTSMQLGDMHDVNQIQKMELSHRLSMKVLKYAYGKDIYADQPTFKSAEFNDGKVYITLNNFDGLYCEYINGVKCLWLTKIMF